MSTKFETIIEKTDNYIDSKLPQSHEARRRRNDRIKKPLAALAIVAGAFTGFKGIESMVNSAPTFSEQTTTHVVEDGEGMQRIVESSIKGIETIDWRDASDYVSEMPENQEVLSNGLQPGETLIVPESVER